MLFFEPSLEIKYFIISNTVLEKTSLPKVKARKFEIVDRPAKFTAAILFDLAFYLHGLEFD